MQQIPSTGSSNLMKEYFPDQTVCFSKTILASLRKAVIHVAGVTHKDN